jgi:GDP-L-fucose synthase
MAADRYEKSQPLFVGSREVVTDDQLMELICDLCAYPGEVRWREQTAVTHVVCADPRLFAQDEIGFGATTSLREGLIETIAWYERNRSRLQKSPHHDRTEHSAPQRTTA